MAGSGQNFLRRGTVAPHNLRGLARREARISDLTAKTRAALTGGRPERALKTSISLCREYRALAAFAVLNMAGSLFIASMCAATKSPRTAAGLDRLGNKYLFRGLGDNVPDQFSVFLNALDALNVLPPKASWLAREMKKIRRRRRANAA